MSIYYVEQAAASEFLDKVLPVHEFSGGGVDVSLKIVKPTISVHDELSRDERHVVSTVSFEDFTEEEKAHLPQPSIFENIQMTGSAATGYAVRICRDAFHEDDKSLVRGMSRKAHMKIAVSPEGLLEVMDEASSNGVYVLEAAPLYGELTATKLKPYEGYTMKHGPGSHGRFLISLTGEKEYMYVDVRFPARTPEQVRNGFLKKEKEQRAQIFDEWVLGNHIAKKDLLLDYMQTALAIEGGRTEKSALEAHTLVTTKVIEKRRESEIGPVEKVSFNVQQGDLEFPKGMTRTQFKNELAAQIAILESDPEKADILIKVRNMTHRLTDD